MAQQAQPMYARHGTLVADAAAVAITITGDPAVIHVKNRGDASGAAVGAMWVTLNGAAPTAADGNDTACVEFGETLELSSANPGSDVVRLFSTGAPRYSVEAYRP